MNNLTTNVVKSLAAAVLLAGSASSIFANSVTLDTNAYSDSYGGGEFTALNTGLSTSGYSSKSLMSGGFETFCLAYNEEFVPGNSYNFTLGNNILSDTHGPAVPISMGTAYLYSQFALGTLAGYDYNLSGAGGQFSSRLAAATALQLALWWAEGEQTGEANSQGAPGAGSLSGGNRGYDSSNYFEKLVVTSFGLTGALAGVGPNTDGVSLLVLTNSNSNLGSTPYSQPQLYHSLPDGGTTIALLGVAFLGLVVLRRRVKIAA